MPPDVRLADAPHLQALHEPTPALRLVPRHILQRSVPVGLGARLRASAGLGGGAVAVHLALGAALFFLLSFRDAEVPREVEIPVEVVAEPPKPAPPGNGARADAGPTGGGGGAAVPEKAARPGPTRPEPVKPETSKPEPARTASAPPPATPPALTPPRPSPSPAAPSTVAPSSPAPAAKPAGVPKAAPNPAPAAPQAAGVPDAPKLVAPPPEAARSATQSKENRPANLVPDEHQLDQAVREARPAAVPQALTTPDARAQASVPAPAKALAAPTDRPTPPTAAKVPSQADRLAAALPMDASALPSPFRSVLAGNAAAQINAAYGGVVQGRIRQATAELSAAASAQRLSGAVAVSFTLDAAGGLASLSVVQSSGDAQLDAMVRQAIERIAPFPPPPPEAEHTFNKAFLIGN